MSGKLLIVILSGPEDVNRTRWALRMAMNMYTHPYGEKVLEDVKVLLFCSGVSIVDPSTPSYEELSRRLRDLKQSGVEVASCISIAEPLGLAVESKAQGIKLVHASVYVAEKVSEGYAVMTF